MKKNQWRFIEKAEEISIDFKEEEDEEIWEKKKIERRRERCKFRFVIERIMLGLK